jgi:hypothetical protein
MVACSTNGVVSLQNAIYARRCAAQSVIPPPPLHPTFSNIFITNPLYDNAFIGRITVHKLKIIFCDWDLCVRQLL